MKEERYSGLLSMANKLQVCEPGDKVNLIRGMNVGWFSMSNFWNPICVIFTVH